MIVHGNLYRESMTELFLFSNICPCRCMFLTTKLVFQLSSTLAWKRLDKQFSRKYLVEIFWFQFKNEEILQKLWKVVCLQWKKAIAKSFSKKNYFKAIGGFRGHFSCQAQMKLLLTLSKSFRECQKFAQLGKYDYLYFGPLYSPAVKFQEKSPPK